MEPHSRAVAAIALFLLLAQGCTSSTPPAPADPGSAPEQAPVEPAMEPVGGFPGLQISREPVGPRECPEVPTLQLVEGQHPWPLASVAFHGEASSPWEGEIHFGNVSVPNPADEGYPHRRRVDVGNCDFYGAIAVMPVQGPLLARFRSVLPGSDRWSEEVRVEPTGQAPLRILLEPPPTVAAGEPLQVRVRVEGEAAGVLALHLVTDGRRSFEGLDGEDFDPLGGTIRFPARAFGRDELPLDYPQNLTVALPGTWILRASADLDNRYFGRMVHYTPDMWSGEVVLHVGNPHLPNVQRLRTNLTPSCFERVIEERVLGGACAGSPIDVSYQVNGAPGAEADRVGIGWSQETSRNLTAGFQPSSWPGFQDQPYGKGFDLPATLRQEVVPQRAGRTYFRAYAVAGDIWWWSEEWSHQVIAAAGMAG